ncbi:MAG: hypothetical protein LKI58_11270 [Actinomyces sp.]|nr:hypothetical protein [Actinomyces sp.]MCI1788619.1 hypothetical protein [Actinomyces sp.]MCI1829721.1 hypothetical protein [Actinomyces sp.]
MSARDTMEAVTAARPDDGPVPADELVHLLETAPAEIRQQFTRGCHLAYETGRRSVRMDIEWTSFQRGYVDGQGAGFNDGYAVGYRMALDRMAEAQRVAATGVRADIPAYADLCDRRGDHARAQVQRGLLRERGIA